MDPSDQHGGSASGSGANQASGSLPSGDSGHAAMATYSQEDLIKASALAAKLARSEFDSSSGAGQR